MKSFSSEEIAGTRSYFESQGFAKQDVSLAGRRFSYFVMPKDLEPNLENFVFRSTGQDPQDYVLGISDQVPEPLRNYATLHEYIEFCEIGLERPGRCRQAEAEVLAVIPRGLRQDYIDLRLQFFNDLIGYCSDKDNFTDEDLSEFDKTKEMLQKIA